MKNRLTQKTLALLAVLAFPLAATAANVSLKPANDASGTTSFTGSTNWNNNAVPSAGNNYFTGTNFLRTPPDALNYTFGGDSLTLQPPASQAAPARSFLFKGSGGNVYTINNFTNAGGIINCASGNVTWSLAGNLFTIVSNSTIAADQGPIIINSPLAGSGNFTNNTSSPFFAITYNGTNSAFTGRFVLGTSAIVIFNSLSNAPGNPAVSTPDQFILGASSTLRDNVGVTLNAPNGGITLAGAATLLANSATSNTTVAVPITGAFTLTKTGAGTVTLSGSNSMTGLTLSGATAGSQLNINSTNALGTGLFTINSGDLATIDNTSGSSLTLLANNTQSWANNFTFKGTTNLNFGNGAVTMTANRAVTTTANTLTIGGNIGGAFSLTKQGAGTLALTASNSLTGGVTISGGTLVMGNPYALGTNGMTFGNGSTLDIATDGGDYTNVVNAASGTAYTIASDVKTGSVGITHTLGTFLIGSGSALQMNITRGPNVASGSPQIATAQLTLSGGAGGTSIINPTTASMSITNVTASATSKTLQLDGTNTANVIAGVISDGGANVITLVKTNTSTWTLSGANTYSGSTTVAQGTLALGSGGSLASASVSVSSGATLDVSASSYTLGAAQTLSGNGNVNGNFSDTTGSQIAAGGLGSVGTLTFNNNLTLAVGDTNKFDFTSSTNDLIVVSGNLNPSVGSVINLASLPPGGLANGTYTLMQVSGTISGSASDFVITGKPSPSRQTFTILYDTVSSPKRVRLQVSGSAGSLVWLGTSSPWDIVTSQNWSNTVAAAADYYFDGDNVSLTDLGSAISPVLNTSIQPGSVAVNSANAYTLTGTGKISGSTALTKSGSGTLTISTTNDYTGVTALNGGTVSIATITNGGAASPIGAATSASANLTFNGGTLQYTGDTAGTDRGATLNASGGTVAVSSSTAALAVSGAIAGTSGGTLTKSGNGTLILTGGNTYNGNTVISAGALQVGNGGATGNLGSGSGIVNNSALVALRTGTLTLTNAISGAGNITNNGTGTLVLSGNNTYTGSTVINTGIVQVASATGLGGTPGAFDAAHISINGGELEAATSFSISDVNSGVSVNAGTIGVDSGMTLTISNQVTATTSLTKSRPGTLILSGSNSIPTVLNIDTASTTGSDGVVRITTTNALGGVPTINIRNNQGPGSSTLQLDGTLGGIDVTTSAFNWSGRNNFVPAIQSIAGDNSWNPASVTFNAGGSYYMIQSDAGTLTLPGTFPASAPATGRAIMFAGAGKIVLSGSIASAGSIISIIKTNSGALDVLGSSSYTGQTSVQGGSLNVGDSVSFGTSTTNIEIAPLSGEIAVMNISNSTVNAQRVIIAGASANNTAPGTGTLNQFGGTLDSFQWFTVGSGGTAGGNGTFNMSGGTLNVHVQQMEVANFIGSTGTVTTTGSSAINIWNGNFLSMGANGSAGPGTFTQGGSSTVTFYSDSGSTVGGNGTLYLGRAAGLTNTYRYNLNGGTLTVPTITSASGNSQFYFNGGTLKAARTNSNWMSGLTAANVSGGAIIDDGGYPVTIAQPLIHDPALGGLDGGLTKNGGGTLTLNGTNTYNGDTIVNTGTLLINGSTAGNNMLVNPSALLGGSGTVNGLVGIGGTLSPGAPIGILTISNNVIFNPFSTALFNFGTGTNSKVIVTGNLNISSLPTIAINYISAVPAVGTYTLMQYGTLAGSVGSLTPPTSPNPRFNFALNNNTSAKTIELIVTGSPTNLVWDSSVSSTWDNTSGGPANWHKGNFAGPLDNFYDGDAVLFSDAGWATSSGSANLNVTASPSSVTVSNSLGNDYDFNGSGVIAGPGSLVKRGAGKLTLEVNSTYIGATIISNGIVQIGNGGGTGSLGTGGVTNYASLILDRSDAITMPSPISGSGSVTMALGNVTASGSNYYTGATAVNAGITYLANAAGLGATNGTISVASGAQIYITANVDNGGNPLVLTGTGDGNGALRKGAAGVTTYYGATTLGGDTSISVDGGATLNLASSNGVNGAAANANLTLFGPGTGVITGPLSLGTGGLTKNGSGTWTLGPSNNFTGLTTLNAGTLRVTGGSLGNPAAFTANQITFGGGNLGAAANATFNDGKAGFTVSANASLIVDSGVTLTISNEITGSAALTKASPGTLVLNGFNSFSGTLNLDTFSTTANDGAVRVTTSSALTSVASPINSRNNNGGSSILQLDGTAGSIAIAQNFAVSCRNSGVAWIENMAGNNQLAGLVQTYEGGGTLIFQSDAGQLEYANNIQYSGSATAARTYNFTGTGNHLVSGVILNGDNGAIINVSKSGTGTATLAAANAYVGSTTVSAGTLLVNGSINSTNGVSVTGGTLGGTGTINDTVTVSGSGTLSPGASIGTLTINSNLTLSGITYIEVNKTAGTRDQVVGLSNVNYGGTLFATNLSGTLNIGDSFTIFSTAAHTGGFASITGSPGAGKAWSFNTNSGVLSVVLGVATNPTNITAKVNGNNLELSWPADHLGWRLQAQTNTIATGLYTNWVDVAGTGADNHYTNTINPTKGSVFYRMVYP